jgi:NADPH-dependent curcumin reductase CurA
VVLSSVPEWQPGDLCQALATWEEYALVPAQQLMGKITPVPGIPLSGMLNVLGGNGLTAYFGLYDVGQPRPGETVLVSAAAGGVGSIVGQLAKLRGCRVVGLTGQATSASGSRQRAGLRRGASTTRAPNLSQQLKDVCPKGVDVFFDGVGGELLDLVLPRLAMRGRVVVCGAISEINRTEPGPGLRNIMQLMAKRARMEGFVTLDYADRYAAARDELAGYVREGKRSRRATRSWTASSTRRRTCCGCSRGTTAAS